MIGKFKNYYKENYNNWLILGIILFIGYFFIFYMTPMRLDDLTWGSNIGIQRLQNWFDGYNGRYVGNIIVIALTRMPAAFRAIMQLALVLYFFKLVYELLEKHIIAFFASLIAFLLMPLTIFSQTISFVAGFANYFVSAIIILTILKMEMAIVLENRHFHKSQLLLLYSLCFLGQLILETCTIHLCLLTLFCAITYIVQYKKTSMTAIISFILSVLGAVIMFSNKAYLAALQGDSSITYKDIAISKDILSLIQKYLSTFINIIVPKWTGNNSVLNIVLTIFLILINKTSKKTSSKLNTCMQLTGIMFLAFFLYDLIDIQIFSWGKPIWAIISLAFWGYLALTIFLSVTDSKTKLTLTVLCFSQPILVCPLLFVSPIGDRCFLHPYIFSIILTGYLIKFYMEERAEIIYSSGSAFHWRGGIFAVFFLISFLIASQTPSWHIEKLRKQEIKHCIETGSDTLVLPNVPYSTQYCFGANISNDNHYWLSNYKNYWKIPQNVKLSFVDYPYWKNMKHAQGDSEH